jgi:hypothetical protein
VLEAKEFAVDLSHKSRIEHFDLCAIEPDFTPKPREPGPIHEILSFGTRLA